MLLFQAPAKAHIGRPCFQTAPSCVAMTMFAAFFNPKPIFLPKQRICVVCVLSYVWYHGTNGASLETGVLMLKDDLFHPRKHNYGTTVSLSWKHTFCSLAQSDFLLLSIHVQSLSAVYILNSQHVAKYINQGNL